jgi:hypothetical protein
MLIEPSGIHQPIGRLIEVKISVLNDRLHDYIFNHLLEHSDEQNFDGHDSRNPSWLQRLGSSTNSFNRIKLGTPHARPVSVPKRMV